ncbi:MAG: hypothetical protein IJ420_02925 [Lachnospiraceae bacterium]|nr:hypothetical protein [Lachnospiraceae bacterium]
MISSYSKTTSITATSSIDGTPVVSMRATVGEDNTWNIAKTVRNPEVYLANQDACDADYAEFEAKVLEAAKE